MHSLLVALLYKIYTAPHSPLLYDPAPHAVDDRHLGLLRELQGN